MKQESKNILKGFPLTSPIWKLSHIETKCFNTQQSLEDSTFKTTKNMAKVTTFHTSMQCRNTNRSTNLQDMNYILFIVNEIGRTKATRKKLSKTPKIRAGIRQRECTKWPLKSFILLVFYLILLGRAIWYPTLMEG